MKNILITGANSDIAKALIDILLKNKIAKDVHIYASYRRNLPLAGKNFTPVILDICDDESFLKIKKGIQNVVAEILERNYYKKIKFYITFDVDVLDMAYLQGTGIPQQGGLLPNEINYFMRGLKDLDVVGLDIVELNSILDCSDNSFVVASEILYNYLAFGYNK